MHATKEGNAPAPVLLHVVWEGGLFECCFGKHVWPVHVRRVHQAIWDAEADWVLVGACKTQVATPPRVLVVVGAIDALDKDQHAGAQCKDRVANAPSCSTPVSRAAIAPSRSSMGLVLQVACKEVPVALVAGDNSLPGSNGALLGELRAVPQLRNGRACCQQVHVEHHQDALLRALLEHVVEESLDGHVPEAWVGGTTDRLDLVRFELLNQLDREGDPQRVELVVADEAQDAVKRHGPQAMQRVGVCLKAEPIGTLDMHTLAVAHNGSIFGFEIWRHSAHDTKQRRMMINK
jgi:hypothetical protein